MSDIAITVTDNPELSRFEARLDGELAGFLDYEASDGVLDLTHTRVPSEFEGRGIGSRLIQQSLDAIRSAGRGQVIATCPFVKSWIERHPDYAGLLA